MFVTETEILVAIAVNKDSGKGLINRPMDVIGEYIGYLHKSLAKRGYLKGNSKKGYQLTSVGRRTLLGFLREHEARAENAVTRLKQLGIEFAEQMDKPRKDELSAKREVRRLLHLLTK